MSDFQRIPVFDGHNDAVQKLAPYTDVELRRFVNGSTSGHIDLSRARKGGFGGGMFAISVSPPPLPEDPMNPTLRTTDDGYEVRLADPMEPDHALRQTMDQLSALLRLESVSSGGIRIVRSGDDLEAALSEGVLAMVLHIEGADAIDPEARALDVLHAAGVRSLGPVWSRPNAFGHGVPFRFPVSPDTGPGLTEAGKALVRRCNELGILIDVSHLNTQGFRDVTRISKAPIVATHSSAWAICRSTRNLTDDQLATIRDSDGLVGVNFEVSANRPDGWDEAETPIGVLVAMIDYLVERIGISRVGFGSDFDGATMPNAIGDVAGIPVLIDALRQRGYDDTAIEKLAWRNWLRVLRATWRSA